MSDQDDSVQPETRHVSWAMAAKNRYLPTKLSGPYTEMSGKRAAATALVIAEDTAQTEMVTIYQSVGTLYLPGATRGESMQMKHNMPDCPGSERIIHDEKSGESVTVCLMCNTIASGKVAATGSPGFALANVDWPDDMNPPVPPVDLSKGRDLRAVTEEWPTRDHCVISVDAPASTTLEELTEVNRELQLVLKSLADDKEQASVLIDVREWPGASFNLGSLEALDELGDRITGDYCIISKVADPNVTVTMDSFERRKDALTFLVGLRDTVSGFKPIKKSQLVPKLNKKKSHHARPLPSAVTAYYPSSDHVIISVRALEPGEKRDHSETSRALARVVSVLALQQRSKACTVLIDLRRWEDCRLCSEAGLNIQDLARDQYVTGLVLMGATRYQIWPGDNASGHDGYQTESRQYAADLLRKARVSDHSTSPLLPEQLVPRCPSKAKKS